PPNRTCDLHRLRLASARAEEGLGWRPPADPSPRGAGKPVARRPGVLSPSSTACPSADSDGHAVARGRAPRRPSRRASPPHGRAGGRRATPPVPARVARGGTLTGRAVPP